MATTTLGRTTLSLGASHAFALHHDFAFRDGQLVPLCTVSAPRERPDWQTTHDGRINCPRCLAVGR